MKADCVKCKFFHAYEENDLGECRRYAPKPFSYKENVSEVDFAWPIVHPGQWCGEFEKGAIS